MGPESDDVRLTRLEVHNDDNQRQIRALGPLVTQYAVLEERLGNFRGDLNEGLAGIRDEIHSLKTSADTQFKAIAEKEAGKNRERRAIYTALALSLFGLVTNLALQIAGLGGHP